MQQMACAMDNFHPRLIGARTHVRVCKVASLALQVLLLVVLSPTVSNHASAAPMHAFHALLGANSWAYVLVYVNQA